MSEEIFNFSEIRTNQALHRWYDCIDGIIEDPNVSPRDIAELIKELEEWTAFMKGLGDIERVWNDSKD